MKEVLIFDNIVPKQHQDFLEEFFLRGDNKWYFQHDITFDKSQEKERRVNHYGFASLIYDRNSRSDKSIDFFNLLPVIYQALDKCNLTCDTVLRMRSFLQLPIVAEDNAINNPHVDLPINHLVILYYLTDSDGDTIIYNEMEKSENYTVLQTVTPKKGRCVVFDGRRYHSSSRPTENIRCILNINLLTK
jgi:hypothetical protein